MSSKRKTDSARANGAKSHGPATEAGRKKSSMNALKYGLTARTVVLPNENDDEYTYLLESYAQKFQPADPVEMDLVVEMVNAKWRQRRLFLIEFNLYEEQMQNQKEQMEEDYKSYNESVEHACAFRKLSESGCTAMLSRAESRLERTFSRALRNLLQLRQDARKNDSEKRTESQDRSPAANHQRHVDAQPPIEQSGADDRFSSSALSPTKQATKNDGLPTNNFTDFSRISMYNETS